MDQSDVVVSVSAVEWAIEVLLLNFKIPESIFLKGSHQSYGKH
jgi:hypothetical protein